MSVLSPFTLVQHHVSTKLEVSIRLSYLEKFGGRQTTDGLIQIMRKQGSHKTKN